MTVQQAHKALLEELLGNEQDGLLFHVPYTTLLKMVRIARLEGHRPLKALLEELTTQRPAWRVEREGQQEKVYLTPAEFAPQVPDLLHLEAWLIIRPDPSPTPPEEMTIVATLHLSDGDMFTLVIPIERKKTEGTHGQ